MAEKVRSGRVPRPAPPVSYYGEEECRRGYQQAHAAVLAQILPEEEVADQENGIRELAAIPLPEATRHLARMAVFSPEPSVRAAALTALDGRSPGHSTDVFIAGLRYPWPAVAAHAAQAIVRLQRKDLIPSLQAMLVEDDPRAPRADPDSGPTVAVAHEVVRINHHRNCLLCHAPAAPGKTPGETLVGRVPVPSVPLPSSGDRYYAPKDTRPSNLLVRVDVTYLRQDFSTLQPVYDSSVWRALQRFDFVVRKRVLTTEEVCDLRTRLIGVYRYQDLAARTLRALTGRDFKAGAGAHGSTVE
jgi:hypothetical protein